MQSENQDDSQLTDATFVVHPSSLSGSVCSNHNLSFSSINNDVYPESSSSSPDAQSFHNSPTAPPYSPLTESTSRSSEENPVILKPDQMSTSQGSPSQGTSLPKQNPLASSSPDEQANMPISCTGYKLVGDNIDKTVKPRYMRSDRQTQSLHYFHLYAVKDRVNSCALSDSPPSSPSIKPDELCKMLLPSENDSKSIHDNFNTHVARILVNNLPAMKLAFDDLVDWHIQHPHSREMRQKSEVVSRYLMSLLVSLQYTVLCTFVAL